MNLPNIHLSAHNCGGCPAFISRFDDLIHGFLQLDQIVNVNRHNEKAAALSAKVEILIDMLMSFDVEDKKNEKQKQKKNDEENRYKRIPEIKTVFLTENK